MKKLLATSLTFAMERLAEHIALVREEHEYNVDESTFRSMVLAEIKQQGPDVRCQIEWNRFDLLIQKEHQAAVVEFKFYFPARRMNLDGTWGYWKGKPGRQNENEFAACIHKLATVPDGDVDERFLVLAYAHTPPQGKAIHSFSKSYDDLTRFGVTDVTNIKHQAMDTATCKLIRILPASA